MEIKYIKRVVSDGFEWRFDELKMKLQEKEKL